MIDHITKLIADLKDASERPEIKGGRVDFLLKSAALHLEDQQEEIKSLKDMNKEMSCDNENLRSLYDNTARYDGY